MERILALSSHIDDVELAIGGTLIRHRDAGDRITIAVMKSDDCLTGDPNIRKSEQEESANLLRVDTTLFFDGEMSSAEKVGLLDEIHPTILYSPFGSDSHQDHVETAQIGLAVGRLNHMTVLKYLSTTSHSYYPNFLRVIDIEAKKSLVSIFASQMVRRPKFLEVMEAQNRFFGSLIPGNGHYAEGFVLHRQIVF